MPHSPIRGLKALSIGDIGTGKTTLIKSIAKCGITPVCIFTEPSQEVLGDTLPEDIPWVYIKPMTSDIENLKDAARRASTLSPDQMQKVSDGTRSQRNQFMPILDAMSNFKCQRTGKVLGNVSNWGTDKCLVVDSLSGLTVAANKNGVGEKYALTQPEFQIVMKTIENFVRLLTTGLYCHVYLTSHPEREMDEVAQTIRIYPSTIGRKLAPVLGRDFSDVFQTRMVVEGSSPKWFLDTISSQAALKARNFPLAMNQPLDFKPAFENWKKRGGIITADLPPVGER